jgi:hypothetical protein
MFFKSKLTTALAATIIAACMLLLGGATAARADDLVTYTLSNVTFADGGTASGSFVVDRLVVAQFLGFPNVTTTTTASFTGTTYNDPLNAFLSPTDLLGPDGGPIDLLIFVNTSGTQELELAVSELPFFALPKPPRR